MHRGNQSLKYSIGCEYCGKTCERNTTATKCEECGRLKTKFQCRDKCNFRIIICGHCESQIFEQTEINRSQKVNEKSENRGVFFIIIPFLVLTVIYLFKHSSTNDEPEDLKLMKELRKEFPSQESDTWYHVLHFLNKTTPSVKSIVFLHGEDKRTPDCLTRKLVTLSGTDKNVKNDEITFSAAEYKGKDYGFALQHYRSIVEKFRIFITDLTIVPGSIARIFHSLCDEVSSDIRPSFFIFTLKYDNSMKKLKPLNRAAEILRKAWSDLPPNEIDPLLSRIVKNVAEIRPEEHISC